MQAVESDAAGAEVLTTREPSFFHLFRDTRRLKPLHRLMATMVKIKAGRGVVPEPLILMTFKKKLFGKYFSQFCHRAMSQSQHWTRLQTELFAGFTAVQLNCDY